MTKFFLGLIAALVIAEAHPTCSWLAGKIVALATLLLPKEKRDDRREEWSCHVVDLQSEGRHLTAMVWAFGSVIGAARSGNVLARVLGWFRQEMSAANADSKSRTVLLAGFTAGVTSFDVAANDGRILGTVGAVFSKLIDVSARHPWVALPVAGVALLITLFTTRRLERTADPDV